MRRNRVNIIAAALVVLFFALRALLYEKKEVRNIPIDSRFSYEMMNAEDLWLFRKLLKRSFEDVNMVSKENLKEDGGQKHNTIFVNYVFDGEYDSVGVRLYQRAFAGETVLVSSNYISFRLPELNVFTGKTRTCRRVDLFQDSTKSFERKENLARNVRIPRVASMDSVSGLAARQTDFFTSRIHGYNTNFDWDTLIEQRTFVDTTLRCFTVGEGKICFHNNPYLFTNIGSLDPGYLAHYNRIAAILNPSYGIQLIENIQKGRVFKSPLRFVLSKRSFRWTIYLLLALMAIYFLAESRRKMRAVPLVEKKKNTTLDFVDTISRLYRSSNRNDKMRDKMEANFYSYVEQKYFLYTSQIDFWEKLQSKSKVQENLLNRIKNEFESKNELTDLELKGVYNKLNMFYKTAE